jgi:adenine-specific DNA-methyltransferase
MTSTEQKLRDLLNELFRFDRSDLDFGIYRIMNLKRDQVQHFIDVDLLPQIRQVLERTGKEQNGDLEMQLDKAREAAKAAGLTNPDEAPKVKELLGKYRTGQSLEEQERQVFGHLFEFFRRYYKDGDFIPQARYKKGVYALPYEGEEVKLSWANQDQYYIKSSEELRDYSFTLSDKRLVRFRVVQAEGDRDNNKTQQDKDRRLILASDKPIAEENDELVIRFEYRPDEGTRKQDEINAATVAAVIAKSAAAKWKLFLQAQKPGSDKGVLAYHLRQYTARNTFDYFIHKDLGGFLRRELDFYLKNEVLDFDTLAEQGAEQSLQRQFGIARAVQQVGGKITDFLAQLEEFQKKLWLKKKFVVRTDWCVTLNRVPHELYAPVAANTRQIEEWKHLFAVQDIEGDTTTPGFKEPPSILFLEHNPYLLIDTRFFDQEFKDALLAGVADLDQQTDGVLIHSENFQALSLLQAGEAGSIRCIYIDPPYNTNASEIAYKNNYKESSFLSFAIDRLQLGRLLLSPTGVQCTTIDDTEFHRLRHVLECVFGTEGIAGVVCIQNNPSGRSTVKGISIAHEYAIFTFAGEGSKIGMAPRTEAQQAQYGEHDELGQFQWRSFIRSGGANDFRSARPRLYYPLLVRDGRLTLPKMQWNRAIARWEITEQLGSSDEVLLPVAGGVDYTWRLGTDSLRQHFDDLRLHQTNKGRSVVQIKFRIGDEGVMPKTVWDDKLVNATAYGTTLLRNILGESQAFSFPKSIYAVERSVRTCNVGNDGDVLDYFAGSGTTAHAVINLNREDGGRRKYILVEMGDYFDTVLKPRIEKVIYSKDWKDGRPVSREGSSHMFKYMTLESYDDTLANLQLKPEGLFAGAPQAHEQYMLRYMLETETQGSPSLLNTAAFDNPSSYTLKVTHGSDMVETAVDLVETFNYLIGLRVRKVDMIRDIRVVQGASPTGERVLVLWRNVHDINADQLNDWFTKQGYNTRDTEFDVIYVNGDNHLQNLRLPDQTWKVRLIEPDFQRLMFDVQDV